MHKDAKGEGGAEAWASGRDSASAAAELLPEQTRAKMKCIIKNANRVTFQEMMLKRFRKNMITTNCITLYK